MNIKKKINILFSKDKKHLISENYNKYINQKLF